MAGQAEVGVSPRKMAAEGSREREREREIEWAAVSMKGVLEESEINNGFSASSSGVKRKSRRLKVVWSEVFEAEPARHRNACCCLEGLC